MQNFTLSPEKTGLLVIDVQDRLFKEVERACEVMQTMQKMIKGSQILQIPIVVTEQYPKGLGSTIATLKIHLPDEQLYFPKTTFSAFKDPDIQKQLMIKEQWILIGIEAHVCVLQTAKDLISKGKQVVVLNDAITSRSLYDFSTAIAELRDIGARVTSTETVLFELLLDSKNPSFKQISQLIKDPPNEIIEIY